MPQHFLTQLMVLAQKSSFSLMFETFFDMNFGLLTPCTPTSIAD